MTDLEYLGVTPGTCPIWGRKHQADAQCSDLPGGDTFVEVESARAGGAYSFRFSVYDAFSQRDDAFKARLTTLLVDQRDRGTQRPEITDKTVETAKHKHALLVYERADRLLRFMAKSAPMGTSGPSLYGTTGALAWSESVGDDELSMILDYLKETKRIEAVSSIYRQFKVRLEGYHHLESALTERTNRAFVAMWFDSTMEVVYDEGIAPAISEAGYAPVRIDREHFPDKIHDAIIAEIRRSAFVVADFTHDSKGQRGNVYYEAGFAHGLNIPVIFLCRQAEGNENLAFDTGQYTHILWTDAADLKRQLLDKIRALIVR